MDNTYYEVFYRTENTVDLFWAKTKDLAFANRYAEECLQIVDKAISVYVRQVTIKIIKEVKKNE